MWKTFTSEDNVYMLKVNENSGDYEIYLTNLTKLWSCNLSKDLLSQKFQEYNPIIELKNEEALSQTLKLFQEINAVEVLVTLLDSTAKLLINSNLSDFADSKYKIKYELEFIKSESDLVLTLNNNFYDFTKNITIPLLQTVIFLEKQQNMMKNLLLKKDRELEEYQMEKGAISRSDLITETFDPEILVSSSNKLMLNTFDHKVNDHITQKYGEIEEKLAEVEIDSWNNVKRKRKIFNKESAARAKKSTRIVYKSEKTV